MKEALYFLAIFRTKDNENINMKEFFSTESKEQH